MPVGHWMAVTVVCWRNSLESLLNLPLNVPASLGANSSSTGCTPPPRISTVHAGTKGWLFLTGGCTARLYGDGGGWEGGEPMVQRQAAESVPLSQSWLDFWETKQTKKGKRDCVWASFSLRPLSSPSSAWNVVRKAAAIVRMDRPEEDRAPDVQLAWSFLPGTAFLHTPHRERRK